MTDSDFTSNTYREAAREHLIRAQLLHASEQFFLAHFLSGLAVECMLRAYRLRIDPEFDSRHDLRELAKDARFYDLLPVDLQAEYGAKFGLLNLRWRSNQRYMSEQQLRRYLSGIRADFDKKGGQFKNRSRTVLELAIEIVGLGDTKWDSKTV